MLPANPNPGKSERRCIHGAGEMADMTRAYDWSRTPVGAISQWPDLLLSTVNTLLASRQPMFLWWGNELIQFYNDAYRPSLGTDKHPYALGQRGPECWPEIWPIISPLIDEVMQRGQSTWSEDQLIPIYRDGKLEDVYWTFSYSPVWEGGGNICGTLVVCSETTGRVLADRRLRHMLEATTDGVLTIGPDWTITYMNEKGKRILAPGGDVIGKTFWEAYPATVHENSIYVKTYNAAMNQQLAGEFEAYYPEPMNSWYQVNVRPGPEGITLFFSDITARKNAENSVLTERARLLEVLQQAPVFFALLRGPDHVVSMVNPLYLRLINNRDVVGKPVRIALPEAVDQGYVEILDRVYRGDPYVGHDARYDAFAGEGQPPDERYVDFVYQPLREGDGSISGIILLGLDITDRKKAHDALIQTEKLAAVGRLASSIAHEINNPLESVTNLLYLARQTVESPEANEYLETADRELRRVAAITNQTLRFHKQATKPLEVTGDELMDSVLSLYQGRIINANIFIEKRHRSSTAVRCFEGEMRQVISNLIGNSLDAMHHSGGRLLMRSRNGLDHRTGREGLIITIADTGPGMSPGIAQHAFEPFFTTKGFIGTGLGLWISQEIIARHYGRLGLRTSTREGHAGTVITIFLPFNAVSR
jgi:signal transduction histidine kinase